MKAAKDSVKTTGSKATAQAEREAKSVEGRLAYAGRVELRLEKLERHMARLVNRVQALESEAGRPVYDETSEHVLRKGHLKRKPTGPKGAVAFDDDVEWEEPEEAAEEPVRKKRVYTDEERKAIGVRLQTARAKNLGLTLEEFRGLHLRPGQAPTKAQYRAIEAERANGGGKKLKKAKKSK